MKTFTNLCPVSCATTNAEAIPMSCIILQLRPVLHIPAVGAKPSYKRRPCFNKFAINKPTNFVFYKLVIKSMQKHYIQQT